MRPAAEISNFNVLFIEGNVYVETLLSCSTLRGLDEVMLSWDYEYVAFDRAKDVLCMTSCFN